MRRFAFLLATTSCVVATIAACAETSSKTEAASALPDAAPAVDASTILEPPDTGAPLAPCTGGDGFCDVALPTTVPVALNGIWGSGPDDVWIAGSPDVVLHWDGTTLASGEVGTRQTLFGVWGSGKGDVWAFSAGDAIWHTSTFSPDGGAWTKFDGTDGDGGALGWPGAISAMWGRSATDLWAVGPFSPEIGAPTIWHASGWNAGKPTWRFAETSEDDPPHPEPLSFDALWGDAHGGLWIVGRTGKTRRASLGADGHPLSWTAVNSGTTFDLHAVAGAPEGDEVWAAGAGGMLRRFTKDGAGSWTATEVASPTDVELHALLAFAKDDVWAAGDQGTLLHWDGKAWTKTPSPTTSDLYALWGASKGDVWAVGHDVLLHKGAAALPEKKKP